MAAAFSVRSQSAASVLAAAIDRAYSRRSSATRSTSSSGSPTRWKFVGELARADASGLPAVLAFAVQLTLAARWAAMKEEAGRERLEQLVSRLEENAAQSGAASFK